MRISTLAIALCLGISGPALAASKADYKGSLAAAEKARAAAKSVGGEWRDIGKMLKKADAAAKDGHYGKAVKLTQKATRQAQLGREQALAEAAKPHAHPAYLR